MAHRDFEGKRGSHARLAFDQDLSAHDDGQLLRQRQTQAEPRIRARETAFARPERFENGAELVGRNADSGVVNLGHQEDGRLRRCSSGKRGRPPIRSV